MGDFDDDDDRLDEAGVLMRRQAKVEELAKDVFLSDNHRGCGDDLEADWEALCHVARTSRFWATSAPDRTYAHVIARGLIERGWQKGGERIETAEEMEDLPVGSMVLAHWADGSQPDHRVVRSSAGSAASGGFTIAGGRFWTGVAKWGAEITVLYRAEA